MKYLIVFLEMRNKSHESFGALFFYARLKEKVKYLVRKAYASSEDYLKMIRENEC